MTDAVKSHESTLEYVNGFIYILHELLQIGMKPGLFAGFRQWYIMQHWDEIISHIQPKPFVTMITFTVPFNETY